ncbi:ParA family protein [Agrobacterium vitis]|uniref:AAA family ATPase n=1 Tax=Agrobacterium vitis TaxID=373 RepID=UPI0012E88791|nr:ParA family protein [Agrobacterium vitis]MVA23901.1 AAA family ATPase [Agrobacterium vitis]
MPVITFANTKGGAGKTTVALILAGELLRRGYRVTMLDADPQQWISRWHRLAGRSSGFDVIENVDADTIEGQVKGLNSKQTYIIIDLPGGLTPLLAKALGLSDQVLVPVQGSAMDAVGGAQVLDILKELDRKCGIRIPHAVVLTRINSIITTRSLTAVKDLLAEQHVAILDTALNERAAYRDMFISGGTLYSMDPMRVSNLDKAQENARAFGDEIAQMIPIKTVRPRASKRQSAAVKQAA